MDDGGITVQIIAIADAAITLGLGNRALLDLIRLDEREELTDDAARGGWLFPPTIVHRLRRRSTSWKPAL